MADRPPGAMVPASDDPVLRRSKHPMNDVGNARRFETLAAGKLLFVGEIGRAGDWVRFDGARWTTRDGAAQARSVALAVSDALMDESRALAMASHAEVQAVYGPRFTEEMAKGRASQLFDWAMKTGNAERTSGMIKQAASLKRVGGGDDEEGGFAMRAALDDFDTDLYAYHCLNGTLRFIPPPEEAGGRSRRQADVADIDDTAGLWRVQFTRGHDPADMFMQIAAVAYDPAATCPAWMARLSELHDDPVARDAIQRIYGMTLTGLIDDQAFYIFQGKGGDGKSMTNAIIGHMHGDYFRSASPKTFLQSRQEKSGSEHQSDIVRLRGDIRLVVADEPKKGSTWDGERIKQVTGSNVTARAPNAVEEVTFVPHWKLIVECNPLPKAPSDDRGFRRRFKVLPWMKTYGVTAGLSDERPRVVEARLKAEGSGILNWMIEGTLAWLDTGVVPEPEIARIASSSFWATGSAMHEWLESTCDLSDPEAETLASTLYDSFRAFCLDRGDKEDMILKQTSFGNALNERQIYRRKGGSGLILRRGIKLLGAGASGAGGGAGGAEAGGDDLAEGWRDRDFDRFGGALRDDPFGADS